MRYIKSRMRHSLLTKVSSTRTRCLFIWLSWKMEDNTYVSAIFTPTSQHVHISCFMSIISMTSCFLCSNILLFVHFLRFVQFFFVLRMSHPTWHDVAIRYSCKIHLCDLECLFIYLFMTSSTTRLVQLLVIIHCFQAPITLFS